MAGLLASILFIAGYIAIALEHRLFVNKAAASLILAALLWIIAGVTIPAETLQQHVVTAGSDLFGLVVFLLTSMTLVEVLLHYRLFDVVERKLRTRGWNRYQLGWAITALCFVFSMFVPNFTAAIVAIQIARRFFPKEELVPLAALMVIAANAGGAFSPIGDVVTLLLWFADKFTAAELLMQGAIPAIVLTAVSAYFLLRYLPREASLPPENGNEWHSPSHSDWAIILATIISFFLPLGASALNLPPYMGLLAGLGGVWFMIDVAKRARPQETHLGAKIDHFFKQSDIESIQFFIGILLSVAALHSLGILDIATEWMLGEHPSITRLITSFTGLGLASAIVDNVPLTAAAVSSVHGVSSAFWVLLSITVGTGGSLLVIGSAAGIVAMGMLPELNFGNYLKIATLPATIGFAAGILVWVAQYYLFFA